ncbi:MAG: hypothetical protein NC310_02965 [Roseburia sp.]|nr:hypothetical protein [Anaeroplasma bactoclasticum]MCM1196019.1 hypothetical protein [Roseburia sp.]MCM1557087.1 hypothetical protein [Anaeroplasma bactoclasticum]
MKKILAVVLLAGAVLIYGGKAIKSSLNLNQMNGDLVIEVIKDGDTNKGTLSVGGGNNTSNS